MSIGVLGLNNLYSEIGSRKFSQGNSVQKTSENDDVQNGGLRKLEHEERVASKQKSVVEQNISYANQLRASRTQANKVALEKKRLQYSFKKISSQIIRSKTSVAAKSAVQAAKREIMRLKRLKGSGEYDEEEVQLALDHAKSMETVARKKVVHLEQEEMVERHGKGLSGALEEYEKEQEDSKDSEVSSNEEELNEEDFGEFSDYQNEIEYEMQELSKEIEADREAAIASVQESLSELMNEFTEDMEDMLEELDLTELSETLYAPDPNMNEDDLKLLKIKHRTKEMKEIAEADKDYLKGLMEYEKSRAAAIAGGSTGGTSMSFGASKTPNITPVISMPGAAAGGVSVAPTISGGFDVSL